MSKALSRQFQKAISAVDLMKIGAAMAILAAVTSCTMTTNDSAVVANDQTDIKSNDLSETADMQTIHYYIGKLPDREYVSIYGDADNPRPWYTAAEALGDIGKSAIPALIARLDTPDPYELKLVLYALMLASQDPALMSKPGYDYLRLGTVLTKDGNKTNRPMALEWWQRYQHLWHQPR